MENYLIYFQGLFSLFNGFVVQQPMNSLIKLGRCPGWSESSLNAQPFFWFCLHSLSHFYGTLGLNKQEIEKQTV